VNAYGAEEIDSFLTIAGAPHNLNIQSTFCMRFAANGPIVVLQDSTRDRWVSFA
jgi:hypothetical protein